MSVIIKDMEMPKTCSQCEIWSMCWDERPFWFERLEYCPLMEMADRKTEPSGYKTKPVEGEPKKFPKNTDKPIRAVWVDGEHNEIGKDEPQTEHTPTHDLHTPCVSQHTQSVERVETYSCQCDCKHWSDKVGRCLLVECHFEPKAEMPEYYPWKDAFNKL